ncbi:skin secretory protein xP2 isoform X22 [Takifugu flavidus]|uniref:skin secretory protein xP2 isoform X22 n=1 Tax=Takifugu flavidus TaxID=433684 RepID=UPI0025441E62|nr:skin secretory protein xP2 isoform X22 [Takifugu flavidus]
MMSYLWILLLGSLLTASVHAQDYAAQMEATAAPEVPATVNAPNAGEPDADTEVGEKTEEVKPETEPNADPELEADKPNGDLGVEDSGAEVPADTGAEVPADTGAEVPADTGAEVPADTGAEVPADTGAEVPADTGAEVPADTGAEVPADTGAEVPADTGAEVPADTGAEVPVDTGVEVPVDTGVEVPADTGAEVPTDTGAEVPASTDTGAEVPVDTGVEVPADTGAEVPASADTGAEVPADEDTDATKLQKESDRKEEADATGQDGAQAGTEIKADEDGVSAPDTSGSDIKEPVEPKNPGSEVIVPEIRTGVNAAVPADEGFNLEDALAAGVDDSSQAGKSSNLETGARAAGATGDAETPEGKEASSGPLAGVLTAIIVAAIGAVVGYFTYQQKKLCFKSRQEADPEAARKADPAEAQSEPQVLSNLLDQQ